MIKSIITLLTIFTFITPSFAKDEKKEDVKKEILEEMKIQKASLNEIKNWIEDSEMKLSIIGKEITKIAKKNGHKNASKLNKYFKEFSKVVNSKSNQMIALWSTSVVTTALGLYLDSAKKRGMFLVIDVVGDTTIQYKQKGPRVLQNKIGVGIALIGGALLAYSVNTQSKFNEMSRKKAALENALNEIFTKLSEMSKLRINLIKYEKRLAQLTK